jgi:hypothetical protein
MKPQKLTPCEFVPLPEWAERDYILNRFDWTTNGDYTGAHVSVGYATAETVADNGTVLVEKNSIVFGRLPYPEEDIKYRFNVYDDKGNLIYQGCVAPEGAVSDYPLKLTGKKGRTYEVTFPDLYELNKRYFFNR